jgi:hypothetical protein
MARVDGFRAAALGFAWLVSMGVSEARADTCVELNPTPSLASDRPADPARVRELKADLGVLFEKIGADLDARARAKADALAERAASENMATLLEHAEQNLVLSRSISHGMDRRLDRRKIEVSPDVIPPS